MENNMKRILSLTLMSLMLFSGYASARNIYDSYGHLIYDDSIRGRQRAAKIQAEQRKIQAAAAARLDIENLNEELNKPTDSNLKSNYIQSQYGQVRELPDSNLKSNYIQSQYK